MDSLAAGDRKGIHIHTRMHTCEHTHIIKVEGERHEFFKDVVLVFVICGTKEYKFSNQGVSEDSAG